MRQLITFALLVLTTPLLAQGSDDCGSAQSVTGPGPHAFDNSAATTDGLPDPMCNAFGTSQIEQDVWFIYTASADALILVSTCNQTGVDTRLAVYDGTTCNDPILDCNDDTCGLQSQVTFPAVTGNEYLIRLGTYPGAAGGIGTFDVTPLLPVVNPNNGHAYIILPDGTGWDNARAAAEAMTFNGMTGHLVTITDLAEHDWIVANFSWSRVWIGLVQNTSSATYSEPGGGWEWITGEPVGFTYWSSGEPNDNPAGEDFAEWHGGGWNDMLEYHTLPDSFMVEFDGLGGGISLFCDPANATSAGTPVTLENSDISGPGLFHLEATGGPVDQFGYFLVSAGEAPSPIAVSQGLLCLSAPIGRYNGITGASLNSLGQFDGTGVLSNLTGTSSVGTGYDVPAVLPDPPAGVIATGDTYYFQLWFRDVGGASNFSNGISVVF